MLVGVLAGPLAGEDAFGSFGDGASGVLFYVVIYGIANLGAFAVLGLLRVRGQPAETLRDVAGLLRRQPGLALLLVLAMFTLMSLPPTPGFWGKLGLFGSAVAAAQLGPAEVRGWMIGLVIVGVLNSALAAAYYLRVIAAVLLYESDQSAHAATREAPHMGALLCGFLTLIFMFYPGALLAQGRAATSQLAAEMARVAAAEPLPPPAP
jgi:NADH-quinone oxidoreductase subunit N